MEKKSFESLKKKSCLITIVVAIQTFISSFEKILYESNDYLNMQ